MEHELQECDLIMKGGITSGVVYPHALVEIAKDYRLRNIGGTSAGAIAAVFAAAAEYRRQSGGGDAGFAAIGALANELGRSMRGLFQPSKPLKPLFDILISTVSEGARAKGKLRTTVGAIITIYWLRVALALAAILLWGVLAWSLGNGWVFATGLMLTVLIFGASLLLSARRMITKELPRHDFGVCSGISQSQKQGPGVTDWIVAKIDEIAGHQGAPLTVGQLEARGIQIAAMTTDLSTRRPYQLPLRTRIFYFSKKEFEQILPQHLVDYLADKGGKPDIADPSAPADLYRLPIGPDFPVALVARMSLSFPGLIAGVPLYRHDNGLRRQAGEPTPIRRCLFSDGGISSNFPVHFFDALAPVRPTFGIALSDWDRTRHGEQRTHLPTRGSQSTALPVRPVTSLGGFCSAILGSAKDWQDTMQSMLPGYAERIVTVRLDPAREGGLNLAMDADMIAALTKHGGDAGVQLRQAFSYRPPEGMAKASGSAFDQHRYNRAISLLPEIEAALIGYATAMDARPVGAANALSGEEILTDFDTEHYKNSAAWRTGILAEFARKLAAIGHDAKAARGREPPATVGEGRSLPATDSVLRLVAQADRVPRVKKQPS